MGCNVDTNLADLEYGFNENTSFYEVVEYENADGTPFDFTGYSGIAELIDESGVLIYTFDTSDSNTMEIPSPSDGKVYFKIDETAAALLSFRKATATAVFTNPALPTFPQGFYQLTLYFKTTTVQ